MLNFEKSIQIQTKITRTYDIHNLIKKTMYFITIQIRTDAYDKIMTRCFKDITIDLGAFIENICSAF